MTYEILAFKYAGPLKSSGAFVMWFKEWEKTVERNCYFWLIRQGSAQILVDAGATPDLAVKRNLSGYISPEKLLQQVGLLAADVQHVILTHLHWDHAGGASLFPNARFYVQEKEYRFWLDDPISERPPFKLVSDNACKEYLRSLESTDRLVLLKGDREIFPGIECLEAPGHTPALQAVSVNTGKGKAILGSDCAHFFRNYREDWPSSLITDLVAWMKTYDKLRSKVASLDLLFPGHDPLMTTRYEKITEGVTRLA
jgi:glyoxylase-like metal-dependent hydrolase (beta-lactamase superfamily II)